MQKVKICSRVKVKVKIVIKRVYNNRVYREELRMNLKVLVVIKKKKV